ncbi:hypothetical protein JAAARDRAFT_55547 [Jaapia argillacea MUCL 33604]|uniref:C3H1-type domain-containing protein n=1 Tax=Jaapia argillacea MUCL 33604 TaxID=933084 RepID=A0A067Q167_9AGAM|nr:hypothetical protein JAAARDRAFT_55547 [Jaapia argillacea MUCL 33604]
MPPFRCRNYDDDGNPIGRGCRGLGSFCAWVHPSEQAWSSVARKPTRGGPPLGRGGSFGSSSRRRSDALPPGTSDSFASPTPPAQSPTLPSSWGVADHNTSDPSLQNLSKPIPTGPRKRSGSKQNDPNSWMDASTWGESNPDGGTEPAGETGGGWGNSTPSFGAPDSGWGDSEAETTGVSGWGSSTGGGWGQPSVNEGKVKEGGGSGNGWGSTDQDDKPSAKSNDWGWGTQAADSGGGGWGTQSTDNASGGWGNTGGGWGDTGGGWGNTGTGSSESTSQAASGWGTGNRDGGGLSSGGWGSSTTPVVAAGGWGSTEPTIPSPITGSLSKVPDIDAPATVLPSDSISKGKGKRKSGLKEWFDIEPKLPQADTKPLHPPKGPSISPHVPSPSVPWADIADDATIVPNSPMDIPRDWHDIGSEARRRLSTSTSRGVSPAATDLTTRTDRQRTPQVPVTLDEKRQVWRECIQVMRRVARLQTELTAAEEAKATWKRTQLSAQFHRAGHAGRKKLDDLRRHYDKRVQSCEAELKNAFSQLSYLPPMTSLLPDTAVDADEDPHRVHAYSQDLKGWLGFVRPIVHTLSTADTENTSPEPGEILENEESRSAKRQRLTPHPFQAEIEQLQEWLDHYEAVLPNFDQFTQDGRLETKLQKLVVRDANVYATVERAQSLSHLRGRTDDLSIEVSGMCTEVAETRVNHVAGLTADVGKLRAETKSISLVYDGLKIQARFDELSQRHTSLEGRLQENSKAIGDVWEQLKVLSAAYPPTPPMVSPEDVLSSLRNPIVESLNRKIQPALHALKAEVGLHLVREREEAFQSVWVKLQPALKLSDAVCKWGKQQNALSQGI